MSGGRARKGIALLMTLFVVAFVTLVLTGFAGHSLSVAYEAGTRQQELQLKWGRASCERVLLRHAATLLLAPGGLDDEGSSINAANRMQRFRFELGGYAVLAILQDESSKMDINLASDLLGDDAVVDAANNLIGDANIVVAFSRSNLTSGMGINAVPKLQSWDQVLAHADGSALTPNEMLLATRSVTLWGGRINIRTAPDDVIYEVASAAVGATIAQRLVDLRSDGAARNLPELLAQVGATERQFADVARLFGDTSTSRSVFTLMERDGRAEYSFVIERVFSDSLRRYYAFGW